MRKILVYISILLLACSGFILFRAASIPTYVMYYDKERETTVAQEKLKKSEEMLKQNSIELEAKQNLVEELQATIAGLEDEMSRKSEEQKEMVVEEAPVEKERVLAVFSGTSFSSGQILISDELKLTVEDLVNDIQQYPSYRVIIEGHTDNIPIRVTTGKRFVDNMELSFLRAKSVAKILIKKNIPADRISVIGYGDTRPQADNATEEGRAINRRVEVKLVTTEKEL